MEEVKRSGTGKRRGGKMEHDEGRGKNVLREIGKEGKSVGMRRKEKQEKTLDHSVMVIAE